MGTFRLGSHLSCLFFFLTLGIRDLGYELDHAWEHTEYRGGIKRIPRNFVAPGAYQFALSIGVLPINFMNHCIICLSISGIGEITIDCPMNQPVFANVVHVST